MLALRSGLPQSAQWRSAHATECPVPMRLRAQCDWVPNRSECPVGLSAQWTKCPVDRVPSGQSAQCEWVTSVTECPVLYWVPMRTGAYVYEHTPAFGHVLAFGMINCLWPYASLRPCPSLQPLGQINYVYDLTPAFSRRLELTWDRLSLNKRLL